MEMRTVVFVSLFLMCLLVTSSEGRRKKARGRQVRSENIQGGNETGFGPWGAWTKCNRHCRQLRFRSCHEFEKCGNKTQKMFKSCRSSQCNQKNVLVVEGSSQDGKKANVQVLNGFIPYLYSEWSSWSLCTHSCYTKRVRMCRFPEICGTGTREDYKPCFNRGHKCENKFIRRVQHSADGEANENDFPPSSHPNENVTCGVPAIAPADVLRIRGGRRAVKGSWPWQVLILNKHHQPYCGGALLSAQWVLTAAHCLRLGSMFVVAGEHDLSRIEGTEQEALVASYRMHPDYDPLTVDNDLALLRLRNPLQLTRFVSPVCLPDEDEQEHMPYHSRATILGWGKRRNESFYGTDVLHQAEVPIVTAEECFSSYGQYGITENMLCAGFRDGKVDSCRGDSGGPLLHRRRGDGAWAVYGVTSFGDGCGEKDKYGVYANVAVHLPWIWMTLQEGTD